MRDNTEQFDGRKNGMLRVSACVNGGGGLLFRRRHTAAAGRAVRHTLTPSTVNRPE